VVDPDNLCNRLAKYNIAKRCRSVPWPSRAATEVSVWRLTAFCNNGRKRGADWKLRTGEPNLNPSWSKVRTSSADS
jgi:hypothetical protein